MGMVVQHNMTAMNANRNLGVTAGNLAKSTEKLSSGYKINRAGDNAAGLAISEKMRGQIRGLDQASTNAEDGISMIQTAEGALTETHSILQRMRELAVQASSDTNTDDDRTQIQNEIDQLTQEVDRIATTTEFNTKKLIDGSAKGAVTEKAGKANVDSTFANSTVSAEITTDGSAKAAFTDVIRIEITQDFAEGESISKPKYTDAELVAAKVAVGTDTIADALKTAEAKVTANESQLSAAKQAAADTKENIDTYISKLVNDINEGVKSASGNTNNVGVLVDGVSEQDVKAAVEKLVKAYSEGNPTTVPTTTGNNTDAEKALKELQALFNTTTTATTTAAYSGAGSSEKIDTIATTPVAAGTGTTATTSAGTAPTFTTSIGTSAGNIATALDTAAKALATQNGNVVLAEDHLAAAEKARDILADTDLVEAYIEYDSAKTANAANTDTGSVKESLKAAEAAAKAKLDNLNQNSDNLTVTDLFGNSSDETKFEISSKLDKDNNLTVTLKNKEGDDTVITISNADKMKAGDVITITAKEMVETEQAPTGKDAFRLQVGANAGQEVMLGINSMKAKDLNIVQTKDGVEGKALDVTNQASASLAVNAYDMAIQSVSTERAKLGATQNRLEHTISNLDTSSENLQSAESSLRDTDMAEEMTRYSKNNILMQAGQSMLAQANQSTQGVLSLLG